MSERRTGSFAVVVLGGLVGAGLAALAGTRAWATGRGDAGGIKVSASVDGSESAPLVAALALVALAAWGVVLVTRGQARRVLAALGLVASVGAGVALVAGFTGTRDDARTAVLEQGASEGVAVSGPSLWFYLAGVGVVLATGAFAVAVRRAHTWPAMGTKYDAPGSRGRAVRTEDDADAASDGDLWRALDEGRDPTS